MSLTHARGLARLVMAGSGPPLGLAMASANVTMVCLLVLLLLPNAGQWAWLPVVLTGVSAGMFAALTHGQQKFERLLLPIQPRRRALLEAVVACVIGLALAAVAVGAASAWIPRAWTLMSAEVTHPELAIDAGRALLIVLQASILAFPFVLAGMSASMKSSPAMLLPQLPLTLGLLLGAAVGLCDTLLGALALTALLMAWVLTSQRLDWERVAGRIVGLLPRSRGQTWRPAKQPQARLRADQIDWLARLGLPALVLTALGWVLNTGVLTGGGNPTADFLPGMLVHLLIPYPRVFVMMTVLGMPVWAMISSHDPRWNAWQLLPVGRVTIERRAIRGLLLLGLVFAVLDLTGAVATLALRPPTHWFAPPSGLQPAIFGMLLTPIAAAASHVLFLRRGERGATPTALALLTGAWLVGYLLIATNGLATVALGVTGLDLRQLGTLSDPAVVIILLFPSLVIAAVAWMAWLVGTQLVWRLR